MRLYTIQEKMKAAIAENTFEIFNLHQKLLVYYTEEFLYARIDTASYLFFVRVLISHKKKKS